MGRADGESGGESGWGEFLCGWLVACFVCIVFRSVCLSLFRVFFVVCCLFLFLLGLLLPCFWLILFASVWLVLAEGNGWESGRGAEGRVAVWLFGCLLCLHCFCLSWCSCLC